MMDFNIDEIGEHEEDLNFLEMLSESEDFSKEVDKRGLDLVYNDLDQETMLDLMTDLI